MAAVLQLLGGNHAAHAAADDHDLFGRLGRRNLLVFQAERRVMRTGDVRGVRVDHGLIAALRAGDAHADLVLAAGLCLETPLRICKLGSADGDHVGLALRDQRICQRGRIDPADDSHGDFDLTLDVGNDLRVEPTGQIKGRHLVYSGVASGVAAGQIDQIDAGIGGEIDEGHDLFLGDVLRHHLVDGVQPHEQRHLFGNVVPDGANALQQETAAILEASAVFIGAGIHIRI